jgi:hypothetical protein
VSRYEEFAHEFKIVMGRPMETGSLDDRITIQKVAYLLFRKGASSTYSDFSWYLHGVFSWSLWHDVIRSWDVSPGPLTYSRTAALENARQEFALAGLTSYFSNADSLELVTTILRCAKSQVDLREDNSDLITRVTSLKGKFAAAEVISAIGVVKRVSWKFD